jgi:hypothetical protein
LPKLGVYSVVSVALLLSASDTWTQAALDAGLLRELLELLRNAKASLRKEAARTASNITAGTWEQIASRRGCPRPSSRPSRAKKGPVRKEAAWTLCHVLTTGALDHLAALVERHEPLHPARVHKSV